MIWQLEEEPTEKKEQPSESLPGENIWVLEEEPKAYKTRYDAPEKTPEELKKMSLQERMEYAQDLKTEREFRTSKGATKGTLSGLTFGATTNIPGLAYEEGDYGYGATEVLASLIPITGLQKIVTAPLVNLAAKSPYAQKALSAFAHLTGAGLTGAAVEGLEEVGHGESPSVENMLTHGAIWVALDASLGALGMLGRFGKGLFKKSEQLGVPKTEILNQISKDLGNVDPTKTVEAAQRALQLVENPSYGPKPQPREVPVKNLNYRELGEEAPNLAQPIKPSAEVGENLVKDIIHEDAEAILEEVGPRATSDLEFGETVQRDLQENFEQAEALYTPLYQEAEQAAQVIEVEAGRSGQIAENILNELEQNATRYPGLQQTISTLRTVIEDLGHVEGEITTIPLSQKMDVARRLNRIIDYDPLTPSVKNRLIEVKDALKAEVREGLAEIPEALNAFEAAEALYGNTAALYGRDSIKKMRFLQKGEDIAARVRSPSTLNDLRAIMTPEQYSHVEREVLEHLNKLSDQKAKEFFRNIKDQLSEDSRAAADLIMENKNLRSRRAETNKAEQIVLNDLRDSLTIGERPKKALRLWQNEEGQRVVRRALKDLPNEKEIIQYLDEQTIQDIFKTIQNADGTLNFTELNKLLENPALRKSVEFVGGKEAVQFVEKLERYAERFNRGKIFRDQIMEQGKKEYIKESGVPKSTKRGKDILERKKGKNLEKKEALEKEAKEKALAKDKAERPLKYAFDDLLASIGAEGEERLVMKAVASVMGFTQFGLPKFLMSYFGFKIAHKVITSARFRRAYKHAIDASYQSKAKFLPAMRKLIDILDEEDKKANPAELEL